MLSSEAFSPPDLHALAQAVASETAGTAEVRVLLQGLASEAWRAGWAWKEGLARLLPLQALCPDAIVLAWEGGACAFRPGPQIHCALAPSPSPRLQGRPRCPGLGILPEILANPGPALAEIPEGYGILLLPEATSAHDRLVWRRYLGYSPDTILHHPAVQKGVHLQRHGPLVAALSSETTWPLALLRLDLSPSS